MSDIPTKAFHEILRRLPTAALPQFRLVCKAWKHIIDNYLRLQTRNNHLILRDENGKLYNIPLTSLCFSDAQTVEIEATNVKTVIRKGIPIMPEFPVPSCHGLILLWSYKVEKDWAIWNPFTKYCIALPRFDGLSDPSGVMHRGGIGYDRVSNDYKVVRISLIDCEGGGRGPHGSRGLETLIYSMKFDKWHRIADFSNCRIEEAGFGVFANGSIHWIMFVVPEVGYAVECVVALDLSSESYRHFPMPLDEKEQSYDFDNRLDCVNGCLFLSYNYAEKFNVWMMKDCDGESTWMKFISLEKVFGVGMYLVKPKVVAYIESTKSVLIENDGKLLWYDMESKRGKIIEIDGIDSTSFQAFPVCHVRLPGDGAVESAASLVTLKRKRESTKRLRLTLKPTVVVFSRA